MNSSLQNYLKMHRKRTGLYQEHVSRLLGGRTETIVVRHERGQRIPTLKAAIGYAVIYGVSVDELFAGFKEEIESNVRERAATLIDKIENELSREHLRTLVEDPELHLIPCED